MFFFVVVVVVFGCSRSIWPSICLLPACRARTLTIQRQLSQHPPAHIWGDAGRLIRDTETVLGSRSRSETLLTSNLLYAVAAALVALLFRVRQGNDSFRGPPENITSPSGASVKPTWGPMPACVSAPDASTDRPLGRRAHYPLSHRILFHGRFGTGGLRLAGKTTPAPPRPTLGPLSARRQEEKADAGGCACRPQWRGGSNTAA